MPASVIKHKERLAHMTDQELADRHGDTDEQRLRCLYSPRDHLNIVDLKINGPIAVKGPLQLSKDLGNLYIHY